MDQCDAIATGYSTRGEGSALSTCGGAVVVDLAAGEPELAAHDVRGVVVVPEVVPAHRSPLLSRRVQELDPALVAGAGSDRVRTGQPRVGGGVGRAGRAGHSDGRLCRRTVGLSCF